MLDFLVELTRWYNLLFVLPILIALIYLFLHTLTASDIGGLEAGFGDLGVIAADRLPRLQEGAVLNRFFTFLNAGRLPPFMVVAPFILYWGFVGFVCNHWLIPLFGGFVFPALLVSAFVAFILSSLMTRFLSQGIGFVFPTAQMAAIHRADLVGTVATVTSIDVNTEFGMARTEDVPFNVTIFCRIDEGESRIRQGQRVVLWDYDAQMNCYKVQQLNKR
jgi:hypothetical protein